MGSDFLPAATGTATTTMITTTTTTTSSEVANISDAKVETPTDVMTSVAKPVDKPAVAASNAAVGGVGRAGPPPDPSGLVDVVVAAGGDNAKKQSDTEAIVVVTTTTTSSNPEAVAVGSREQTANVTSTA